MGVSSSKIGSKWETVVPKEVRKHQQLEKGQNVLYIDMGTYWKVIPLPKDPLKSLKGSLSGAPRELVKARKAATALAKELALKHMKGE